MNSYIHHIETTVPDHACPQERLSERMQQELAKTEKERRIIRQIYNRSGITTRYSVLPDFSTGTPSPLFQMGEEPGTGERNQIYRTEATRLFIRVAEGLIRNGPFKPDEITHLITVSCTGFFAPGPDFEILRALGL
ncbi:MAG: type III polyketide synthase, partial [Balneolaceae bacterium]